MRFQPTRPSTRQVSCPVINSNQLTVPCVGSVKQGDSVMIITRNGEPVAVAPIGWGDAIEADISDAAQVAAEAQAVAEATGQHFFTDTDGVHVTEAEGDATTGHNILINALGILLRHAASYLVSITSSAIAFYDGAGTAASNIVAQFGATGAQIGKASAGNYVMIDSDSFDLYHGTTEMVHFGYGEGNASGGTTNAPYYTIGERYSDSAVGNYSVAEGTDTTASGYASHAEGVNTTARGHYSHAEGFYTASNVYSHAEGYFTTASGSASHAEGDRTIASGSDSHAAGYGTIAASEAQTALGKYNVKDANDTYAVIIGNGTGTARSNALTVDWDGNVEAAGGLTATSLSGDGSSITSLNGSNVSSGTIAAARVGNLPASKITSGTFGASRLPLATLDSQGAMSAEMYRRVYHIDVGSGTTPVLTVRTPNDNGAQWQMGINPTSGTVSVRAYNGSAWSSWKTIATVSWS